MKKSKVTYFTTLALAASMAFSVPAETLVADGDLVNSVGDLEAGAVEPEGYALQEDISEPAASEEYPEVSLADEISWEETGSPADVQPDEDSLILPEEAAAEEALADEELAVDELFEEEFSEEEFIDESDDAFIEEEEEALAEDADEAEVSEVGAGQHTYTAMYKDPSTEELVYFGHPMQLGQLAPYKNYIEVYEDGIPITNWSATIYGINVEDRLELNKIDVDYPFSCEIKIVDNDTGAHLASLTWKLVPRVDRLFWYFEKDRANHSEGELPYYEYTGEPVCPQVRWHDFGTFKETSPDAWMSDPTHWNLLESGPVGLLKKYSYKFEVSYENNVNPGIAYCIVRGKAGSGYDGSWGKIPFRIVKKSEESSVKKTAPVMKAVYNSAKGADIRWNKVNGAAGYAVYRRRSSEGTKKIATINNADTLQVYDRSVRDNCYGRIYSYYVKALYKEDGKTVEGPASQRLTLQRIAPMKITSASNSSSRAVRLKWKCTVKDNKAHGYEIQYAASKDDLTGKKGSFKTITVKGRNKLSKTISGLSKGNTYWFRIRSYTNYTNTATGKRSTSWSQYSNVAKVKVKK